MTVDAYPHIIGRALEETGDGPYTFAELLEVYDVMTDEFCGQYDPSCSRTDVLDWLLAIGPQGQERLLRMINERGKTRAA